MGMQMHCRGNHAVVVSVDFTTESRQGASPMMARSVVQVQGMEVGNVIYEQVPLKKWNAGLME